MKRLSLFFGNTLLWPSIHSFIAHNIIMLFSVPIRQSHWDFEVSDLFFAYRVVLKATSTRIV